ncbi:phosphate ABC transporter permease PstA [Aquihabitans sp. G128]|uniref:phosphate ABC transporter permease PstA n=1 Tax=Aquihabitans sp. G128 TaxID=2849779 RepID=UPI001C247D78|nr:phosphate ABC transporter permease PstA [Aquihabitans sp. G128]QXC60445.1 phosphate ABC transporter permease PstA [Aquihabitans sp. G128]
MTATTVPPTTSVADRLKVPSDVRVSTIKGARFARNRIATGAMAAAFVLAMLPLLFVMGNVLIKGGDVISPKFLTRDIPTTAAATELKNDCATVSKYDPTASCKTSAAPKIAEPKPGIGPAVVGTLITTLLSAALAIPLGLLAAIYLNEYGKRNRLANFIRFMTDVMTGVPSIVMGIFIYTLWVLQFGQGRSALAASLALACLMLPIVVRSSEEMLRLVPNALREGSAALGSRTWKTTLRVVLPTALPGLVSGSMLAVARAAGETAPVLFTIGAANTVAAATTVTGQSTTLSFQIYNLITNGGKISPQMAWGAALTLIVLVMVLTTIARTVSARFTMR